MHPVLSEWDLDGGARGNRGASTFVGRELLISFIRSWSGASATKIGGCDPSNQRGAAVHNRVGYDHMSAMQNRFSV